MKKGFIKIVVFLGGFCAFFHGGFGYETVQAQLGAINEFMGNAAQQGEGIVSSFVPAFNDFGESFPDVGGDLESAVGGNIRELQEGGINDIGLLLNAGTGIMDEMTGVVSEFGSLFGNFGIGGGGGVRSEGGGGAKIPLSSGNYDSIMTGNKVNKYVEDSSTENSLKKILSNRGGLLPIVNKVMGSIAILWLMILGAKFTLSQGDDDKISKYKQQFGWVAIGLAVISVSEFIAFHVFDPTVDVFRGASAGSFAAKAQQIKVYFQIIVGAIAVAACVMSGYNLITGGSEDEAVTNEKKFLHSFFFGVGFILMAEVITGIVSLQSGAMGSAGGIVSQVVGIVNLMLTFVAVAAVFMLVLSALYYVSSFGNEDQANRAKSIIINSVIAVLVAVSSFVFISFFIR